MIILLCAVGVLVVVVTFVVVSRQGGGQEEEPPSFLPEISSRPIPAKAKLEPRDLSALLPQHFVVLDLETTGLNPERSEIIEFGAIRVTLDSQTHATFQTLVKPLRRIPTRITEITGITQDMVDREGLQLEDALCQFVEFIGDLPLVTFNAEFDIGFLHAAARQHGLAIPNRYTCALKRARRAWPGLSSYRLADLAKLGNLSGEDTHRALGDCSRALIVFTSATSILGQRVRWTTPQLSQ